MRYLVLKAICGASFGLGVVIRKAWLYACAPVGALVFLIMGAQLTLGAMGLHLGRTQETETARLIKLLSD